MQLCSILDTDPSEPGPSRVRYDPATGDSEAGISPPPHVPEGCVDLHNVVIGDTRKPDCASKFIIAALETSLSIFLMLDTDAPNVSIPNLDRPPVFLTRPITSGKARSKAGEAAIPFSVSALLFVSQSLSSWLVGTHASRL
jgi:hypothetical protein